MRNALFGTTARQVGWVVALATLSSNLLVILAWLVLSPGSLMPGSVRALAAEMVGMAELVRHTADAAVPAIVTTAARAGLAISADEGSADEGSPVQGARDAVIARALAERLAERDIDATASVLAPTGSSRQGIVATFSYADGRALRIAVSQARMQRAIPTILLPPTTAVLLLGVPMLLVLLWVASMVTRPLARLARAAHAIGAAGHHVTLPEAGTREIRDVARAINGLLDRLRQDVAERARILAGISHDLRTPLTRLKLRTEMVSDIGLRCALAADLGRMEAIVGASLTLLESDLREETLEVLDLAALASTVCDQFADAGNDVAYHGPLHLVIRAQPTALERALGNLVDNACRHGGGARLSLAEAQDSVRIAVEDEGPGIALTDLPHITEAYRRRQGNAGGFGLGLAIVASVARAHGGQLALCNRDPRGLRAELTLPTLRAA